MNERLIHAALAAADIFREGDTPDQAEVRELVRAADAYRTPQDHEANCLMCAVRALTEGDPAATWTPTEPGATISGVVLRQGEVHTNIGTIPYVDLWQGGTGRVRVMAYAGTLRHALSGASAQIGDRLQIRFEGRSHLPERDSRPALPYKVFSVEVQRGH